MTCRAAIAAYWPADTREQAYITLDHENGAELVNQLGTNRNKLGQITSHDYGCMQLNDQAHLGFDGWTKVDQAYDPSFNVQYALRIYQRANNTFAPWYSVCTRGREVSGITCQ